MVLDYGSTIRRQPPCSLHGGAALGKRTCYGKGRSGRPGGLECGRKERFDPGHTLRRCVAIQGSRRGRSVHTASLEAECGAREISLRKTRTATARCRRCSADSPGLYGDGIAGDSNCGTPGKRVGSPGFSFSPDWLATKTRKEADSMAGKIQ